MNNFKSKIIMSFLVFWGISCYSFAQFFPNTAFQQGLMIGNAIAQREKYSRNYIRKHINEWNKCNNGTLSLEHGAVAIYDTNGYCYTSSVDGRLSSKIKEINKKNLSIDDVNITENGYFVILYDNGKSWFGVLPSSVTTALKSYSEGTRFKSISFNENGIYAIATESGFKSNSTMYQAYYDDMSKEHGILYSVNINNNGASFCFSDGTFFCGIIPTTVENAVKSFGSIAKFAKFNSRGDYLLCSASGTYSYQIEDVDRSRVAQTTNHNYVRQNNNTDAQDNNQRLSLVYSIYIDNLSDDSDMSFNSKIYTMIFNFGEVISYSLYDKNNKLVRTHEFDYLLYDYDSSDNILLIVSADEIKMTSEALYFQNDPDKMTIMKKSNSETVENKEFGSSGYTNNKGKSLKLYELIKNYKGKTNVAPLPK